uniref:Uncharacterized protein n=1 Tax=Amphimedon queenslandica TaxID=400682 RepID=A0A1X7UA18_AMPQE
MGEDNEEFDLLYDNDEEMKSQPGSPNQLLPLVDETINIDETGNALPPQTVEEDMEDHHLLQHHHQDGIAMM